MLDEVVWKQISYTGYQNTWLSDVNYPKYDGHIIVQSSDRDFVFNRPRTFETMYSYDSTDSTLFEQVEDVNMFVYRIDEK